MNERKYTLIDTPIDDKFMKVAIDEAKSALDSGDVPVGACIVYNGEIISRAHNTREKDKNAISHAEIMCIDEACKKLGGWRLWMCDIYVTLEPCPMCAGAIINSRIRRVIFGASDEKAGSFGSVVNFNDLNYNHKPQIYKDICKFECKELLTEFFKTLRK